MKWFFAFTMLYSVMIVFAVPSLGELVQVESSPTPQVLAAVSDDFFEQEAIKLINQERTLVGAPSLVFYPDLRTVTTSRLDDMVKNSYYAHINPATGKDFADILPAGTGYACENLLLSTETEVSKVVKQWLDSPPHKQCLLHPKTQYVALSHGVYFPYSTSTDPQVGSALYVFVASAN